MQNFCSSFTRPPFLEKHETGTSPAAPAVMGPSVCHTHFGLAQTRPDQILSSSEFGSTLPPSLFELGAKHSTAAPVGGRDCSRKKLKVSSGGTLGLTFGIPSGRSPTD